MSFAAVVERLQALENPYPGLRPFETDESHLFFGRDVQVAELVGRLERNRFVAVLGASGSGKSSLVKAGLIPALERGRVSEAGRRWRMVVMRPGGAPFERLAAELRKANLDPSALENSSHGLIEIARQLPADESLLVVVDQFEELFRYKDLASMTEEARRRHDGMAADAAEFVQLLLAASRHQPPVYIIITMRSDYLGDCAEFRDLPETLNDCQYLIPRMTREQRKEAIEGPLGRVEMAANLVQRMLNDAGDEPDQLPVLQHALMRTWSHWRSADPNRTRRIELQDYEAIGELSGALNQHANELLAGVPTDTTATIFKRLTARGRNSRERRNPALLSELWAISGASTAEREAGVNAIIDRFRLGEATFLTPRSGPIAGDTYIDITHECLIRQWRKLGDDWLPAEQRSAKTFLDLVDRSRNWKEQKGEVLIGLDLTEAREWDRVRNPTAAWATHYASEAALATVEEFITASERRERDERDRQRRERLRLRLAIGAAIVAVVAGLGLVMWLQVKAARAAEEAAFSARILSVPSVRDPLVRALLLVELRPHANAEQHLAVYQDVATATVPFAVFRYPEGSAPLRTGFLADGNAALATSAGLLWSWRSDGHGDGVMQKVFGSADGDAPSPLTAAAFSRDGRWIAAGLPSGEVWIRRLDRPWAPSTSGPGPSRQAGSDTATVLAFSPDGRQLAAAYTDASVRVWRLDGAVDGPLPVPALKLLVAGPEAVPIYSVAFDAAGARLITGSGDGTTRMWTLQTRTQRPIARDDSGQPVTQVAFSPDGALVLTGTGSGKIWIRQIAASDARATPIDAHAEELTAAAFSPDGSRILTASKDHTAKVWRLATARTSSDDETPVPRVVSTPIVLTHDAIVTDATFSADGSTIVTASADGTARIWRSERGEPRLLGVHDGRVESVVFSPDGTRVLSASDDRTVRIWGVDRGSKPVVLSGYNEWVRSAAFDPADDRKVLTASEDGTLRLWDLTRGTFTIVNESSTVLGAAFDPAGTHVVTAVADNVARIWPMSEIASGGRPLETPEHPGIVELPHDDWVFSAAFSGDGTRVVTASKDGTVRVWAPERSAREPVMLFRHPQGTIVYSAVFSPDGSHVLTAASDGIARVWRSESAEELDLRHDKDVNKAVYTSAGDAILTASSDGTARLWSASDGGQKLVFQHGTEWVRAVAADRADAHIVTGTADGAVRLWRIQLSELEDYLDKETTACLSTQSRVQLLGEFAPDARKRYESCEARYQRTPVAERVHRSPPLAPGRAQ